MSDVEEWASSMENAYKFPMGDVGNGGWGGVMDSKPFIRSSNIWGRMLFYHFWDQKLSYSMKL